jgi:hypothetical protein
MDPSVCESCQYIGQERKSAFKDLPRGKDGRLDASRESTYIDEPMMRI